MTKLHRWPTATLIGVLILASCGDDAAPGIATVEEPEATTDDSAPVDPDAAPEDSVPGESEPADGGPAADDEVIDVDLEADFGGFRYHVTQAALGERLGSPQVIVSVGITNLKVEAATPLFVVSLHSAGKVFERFGGGGTEIAPGATLDETYEFTVDTDVGLDDAVLFIGEEGSAQASVALTGGAVVSLTPTEVSVDEVGTAELVEMRLDHVLVDWHSLAVFEESADAGSAFLTAVIDVSLGDQSRTATDTFELVLPSGETVTPEKAPNEVINAGETAAGLEVAFVVADPYGGDYVLRLLNLSRFPADTMVEIPFVIDP